MRLNQGSIRVILEQKTSSKHNIIRLSSELALKAPSVYCAIGVAASTGKWASIASAAAEPVAGAWIVGCKRVNPLTRPSYSPRASAGHRCRRPPVDPTAGPLARSGRCPTPVPTHTSMRPSLSQLCKITHQSTAAAGGVVAWHMLPCTNWGGCRWGGPSRNHCAYCAAPTSPLAAPKPIRLEPCAAAGLRQGRQQMPPASGPRCSARCTLQGRTVHYACTMRKVG